MRHVIKILLLIVLTFFGTPFVESAIKGGLEYQIPIDYSKLSRDELEMRGKLYYGLALENYNGEINEDVTSALNIYTILHKQNMGDPRYCVRLGELYDLIDKDRYAKKFLSQASSIKPDDPEPHYRYGNFYYRRHMYKKALAFYKEAYKLGYQNHYDTLYKIGDIYQKFGDTELSLKYLNKAAELRPNEALDEKIFNIEEKHLQNREYYSDTRIRLKEE